MLHLESTSSDRWLKQVHENLEEVLIDHAHCEQKAASTAMNLMFEYVEFAEIRAEMSEIIAEELEHFHMVIALLERRGIRFRKLKPGPYGRLLMENARRQEPDRAVDRLLLASLIEARSCERFVLLRDHLEDAELSAFYGSLYESEARHHTTYVRLAELFRPAEHVRERLKELAVIEADVIERGCELPRVHS